jgi:hypothetical protein
MRGVPAPVGRQSFKTSDPALAQAYAALAPPAGKPLPEEKTFDDRSGLDQALYDLLAGWAREEIATGEAPRLERGLGYLGRAERLQGISPAQRDDLLALRAESGFYEAQRLLEKAAGELRDAAEKLRLASSSRSPHGADAQILMKQVEPAVDAAIAASRAAAQVRARPEAARPTADGGAR